MTAHTLRRMDRRGDVALSWDPDDEASVEVARAEWQRLRDAGFLMFATREEERGGFYPDDRRLIARAGPTSTAAAGAPPLPPSTDHPLDRRLTWACCLHRGREHEPPAGACRHAACPCEGPARTPAASTAAPAREIPAQVDRFQPRSRSQIAVPPMRGGAA